MERYFKDFKGQASKEKVAEMLKAAVQCNRNIMVAGYSKTGKTTKIREILSYVPEDSRILIITAEGTKYLDKDQYSNSYEKGFEIETAWKQVEDALRKKVEYVVSDNDNECIDMALRDNEVGVILELNGEADEIIT